MQLKSDFYSDWLRTIKNILQNYWGYDISNIQEKELPYAYFNAKMRRPEQRKRNIEISDAFSCPTAYQAGWERLKGIIESGGDITPNLSKKIRWLNEKDSLLNDWGVHHFHLGEALEGDFIKRTSPLLFALVTSDKFYAINIFNHGAWANQDIVEIIHRNWPYLVRNHKVNGLSPNKKITESERLILRKKTQIAFLQYRMEPHIFLLVVAL